MTPEQIQQNNKFNELILQWANEAKLLIDPVEWEGAHHVVGDTRRLQAFATIVRNATLEEAAITSWNHYMDTCKQRKMPPAHHEHFIAATTIRSLKN